MTRIGFLQGVDNGLVPINRRYTPTAATEPSYQQPTSIPFISNDVLPPPSPPPPQERSTTTTKPFVKSSSILRAPTKIEISQGEVSTYKEAPSKPRDHLEVLLATFKQMLHLGYQPIEYTKVMCEKHGYTMDLELSTIDTYVYMNNETGFPLIVHRGSITATDWIIEDGLILSTLTDLVSSPRSIYARRITKKVEGKYKKPTDAFGHSLGSRLASVSGANGYIIGYNGAAGFQDIGRANNPKEIQIRTDHDIVSLLSTFRRGANVTTIEDEGIVGSHALKHLPTDGVDISNP